MTQIRWHHCGIAFSVDDYNPDAVATKLGGGGR